MLKLPFMILLLHAVLLHEFQQPPSGSFRLSAVQISGARRYSAQDVMKISGLESGSAVALSDIDAAAQRMASSGLFKNVTYRYATKGPDMTVTFQIEEAEWSVPVVFDNFVWLSDEEMIAALRQHVPSFDGTSPATAGAPEFIADALQKILKARQIRGRVGFMQQSVLKTKSESYVFSVKDPSPRLCALKVAGTSALQEKELVGALASSIGTDYSRFYVTNAANGTLVDLYRQRGHWNANFEAPSAVLARDQSCDGVVVTLEVNEGPSYAWDQARWTGNTVLESGKLDALLGMKHGDVASLRGLNDGLVRIHQAYGRQGHVLQASAYSPRLDDATRRAVFDLRVDEGPQFKMGTVEFLGLAGPDVDRLRRKWKLQPADVFDDSYPMKFETDEIRPLLRGAGLLVDLQLEAHVEKRVVNVRFVFK